MKAILNIGCGNKLVAGAVNHDRVKHRPEVDVVWDLDDLPWPWEDNSFDQVVACAVLEHLRINLFESIGECWRILRPGGELYVKLPYWKSDNAFVDPTHYWRFSLHTLEMFDPSTKWGKDYSFYMARKWKIIQMPKLNKAESSFAAKMITIKPEAE